MFYKIKENGHLPDAAKLPMCWLSVHPPCTKQRRSSWWPTVKAKKKATATKKEENNVTLAILILWKRS